MCSNSREWTKVYGAPHPSFSLSLCMCRFYLSLSSALLLFHPSFKSVSLVVKIVVGMILLSGAQHIFFNLLLLTHSLSPLPNPSSTTIFQPIPFFISHFKYWNFTFQHFYIFFHLSLLLLCYAMVNTFSFCPTQYFYPTNNPPIFKHPLYWILFLQWIKKKGFKSFWFHYSLPHSLVLPLTKLLNNNHRIIRKY